MINYKTCSKCQKIKEASSDYFSVDKNGKYGFKSTCKECDKVYRKKHYQENHEAIREKQNIYLRKYYRENKGEILSGKREYYRRLKMVKP